MLLSHGTRLHSWHLFRSKPSRSRTDTTYRKSANVPPWLSLSRTSSRQQTRWYLCALLSAPAIRAQQALRRRSPRKKCGDHQLPPAIPLNILHLANIARELTAQHSRAIPARIRITKARCPIGQCENGRLTYRSIARIWAPFSGRPKPTSSSVKGHSRRVVTSNPMAIETPA